MFRENFGEDGRTRFDVEIAGTKPKWWDRDRSNLPVERPLQGTCQRAANGMDGDRLVIAGNDGVYQQLDYERTGRAHDSRSDGEGVVRPKLRLEPWASRGLESPEERCGCPEVGVDRPHDRLAFVRCEIADTYLDHRSESSGLWVGGQCRTAAARV